MLQLRIQHTGLLNRDQFHSPSIWTVLRGEQLVCMWLVLDRGFAEGTAWSLVFVALAVSIDPAHEEDFGLRPARGLEHVGL